MKQFKNIPLNLTVRLKLVEMNRVKWDQKKFDVKEVSAEKKKLISLPFLLSCIDISLYCHNTYFYKQNNLLTFFCFFLWVLVAALCRVD